MIIVFITALPLIGATSPVEQQNVHLSSHLGPRAQNVSVTQGDANEKNFTHDELFTLQKRFLDNFISPENDIQVRLLCLRPPFYLC